mmetsp:Transcript_2577/g.2906  ORF Transcript_2577/g.2906 Transcript_2577/m.2906 type:complete len:344 (-) Transcript_2577:279-1310(-)
MVDSKEHNSSKAYEAVPIRDADPQLTSAVIVSTVVPTYRHCSILRILTVATLVVVFTGIVCCVFYQDDESQSHKQERTSNMRGGKFMNHLHHAMMSGDSESESHNKSGKPFTITPPPPLPSAEDAIVVEPLPFEPNSGGGHGHGHHSPSWKHHHHSKSASHSTSHSTSQSSSRSTSSSSSSDSVSHDFPHHNHHHGSPDGSPDWSRHHSHSSSGDGPSKKHNHHDKHKHLSSSDSSDSNDNILKGFFDSAVENIEKVPGIVVDFAEEIGNDINDYFSDYSSVAGQDSNIIVVQEDEVLAVDKEFVDEEKEDIMEDEDVEIDGELILEFHSDEEDFIRVDESEP